MSKRRLKEPCSNCPWRTDVPRGVWAAERWRTLWHACQDDGLTMFACHKSRRGRDAICIGWARVLGDRAIGVRLALLRGLLTLADLRGSRKGLFRSFASVLRGNGITPPRRNRVCR